MNYQFSLRQISLAMLLFATGFLYSCANSGQDKQPGDSASTADSTSDTTSNASTASEQTPTYRYMRYTINKNVLQGILLNAKFDTLLFTPYDGDGNSSNNNYDIVLNVSAKTSTGASINTGGLLTPLTYVDTLGLLLYPTQLSNYNIDKGSKRQYDAIVRVLAQVSRLQLIPSKSQNLNPRRNRLPDGHLCYMIEPLDQNGNVIDSITLKEKIKPLEFLMREFQIIPCPPGSKNDN